ncbi:MAG: hypothetical protein RI886_691, partial [Pseudomonadota bacterium]
YLIALAMPLIVQYQSMLNSKTLKLMLTIVVSASVISSCSKDTEEVERPEQIYYELAQTRMRAKNFFSAVEALEMIEARYPFGRYAEQAQSELIYAHYMNGDDEASHSAAEKFIRLHPRHPNIDYAYFMRGLASYTRDKTLFVRLFNADLSQRDVSGAKQAFAELTEFLTRFPNSQYAPYAQQRLIYLRNLIAQSELSAADYYVRRGAYIAAIRRAKYVLENIPNSSQNLRALKILKLCYKELDYLELENDIDLVIAQNFSEVVEANNDEQGFSIWPFGREKTPAPQS